MKTYFETAIRHLKMMDDGTQKKVTDSLLVDAISFTEAEAKTISYAEDYGLADFAVVREKKTNFSDVINGDSTSDGIYYKIKVRFITIDEKSGKEHYSITYYCVLASSPSEAMEHISKYFSSALSDFDVSAINATNITDIIV